MKNYSDLLKFKRRNFPTIYNGWEQISKHDVAREGINPEETTGLMAQMGPMIGDARTVVIEHGNPIHPIMKLKKSIVVLAAIFGVIIGGCHMKQPKIEDNRLTQAEKDLGWELLFDGMSFSGWRGLGRDTVQTDFWKVEDGTIHKINNKKVPLPADGKAINGGDLMTIKTYDNFELSFDWKIMKGGNSGIKFNVSEEMSKQYGSGFNALGFEYQILDDESELYKGILNPSQFTAALYEMVAPQNVRLNPLEQYNSGRIVLNGNHGEHWLNGVKVVEYEFGTAKFDSLFQLSKYHKYPDFDKKRKGHLVITNHSDESWYKNIKIRNLDKVNDK